jgi:hypothetical protein
VLAVVQPGADDGRHEDRLFLETQRPIEASGIVGLQPDVMPRNTLEEITDHSGTNSLAPVKL